MSMARIPTFLGCEEAMEKGDEIFPHFSFSVTCLVAEKVGRSVIIVVVGVGGGASTSDGMEGEERMVAY